MRTAGLWILALFVAACSGRDGVNQSDNMLGSQSDGSVPENSDSDHRGGNGDSEQGRNVVQQVTPPDGGDVELDCVQGGNTGEIQVVFDCDMITVYTCKDLSNVVIEFDNGDRQRVMGVHGHVNAFSGNGHIIGVWVKSGENGSGDGSAGTSGSAGEGGNAGTNGSAGEGGTAGSGGNGGHVIGGTGGMGPD